MRICSGSSSSASVAAAVAARSAIVSNVVLLLVVACVFGVLVALWVCQCRTTIIEAARIFCLPSSLLPAWTVVVPSTTSGATLLLARLARVSAAARCSWSSWSCAVGCAVRWVCAVVDAFVLAAVSCVSVVSGLTASDAQCHGWSLAVVLVLVVQLALLVALRPFTTVFSSVYNAVTLVLTILSALSQLVFVWAYAADSAGLWLLGAAGGVSLAVVGVSAVKLLLDVHQLVAAVRRRVVALRTLPSAASRESDSFVDLDALLRDDSSEMSALQASQREVIDDGCADSSMSCIRSTLDVKEELSMYDSQFWDVSGAAVGTALVKGDSDILRVGDGGSMH
ncbi:transmembrane protein, putative [Bodo saltans]|uniref:Transmembrane protein, putative n=1 Tax=Bodo saltans TaxID=75058 RepID=A0A0S4IUB3_BODSA|nr:transmembrane protein, putative [Bodo saltans]|eukprot:CUF89906.1 transmembrane protein, putative [Bodo saltans]